MLRIPAMRGEMGEIQYCLTLWTLGEASRNITYSEEIEEDQEGEIPSELRAQRKINWSRVRNEIVPYLTQVSDHFFGALTVEVIYPTGEITDIPFEQSEDCENWGYVLLDGTETLRTLDGQHRLVAIKEALKESPTLAAEKISVILIPHISIKRSQQLFSDLNRNAKPTTKAINVLFEWRGLFEQAAKKAIEISPILKERVELEKNSLARKSPKIITLGVLYEMSRLLLKDRDGYKDFGTKIPPKELVKKGSEELANIYDDVIVQILPEFDKVISKEITPYEYRSKYIATHSAGWQSLASVIRIAIDERPDTWRELCKDKLKKVNWLITNNEWEGTAVSGGLVANRKTNIQRITLQLKEFLGLELTETEKEYFSSTKSFPIKRLTSIN